MSLISENTRRWRGMHVKPSRLAEANDFARRALGQKPLYEQIAAEVRRQGGHIPWYVIAIIHERECRGGMGNLHCSIGQGSPWNVKSKIKPYNGPFGSFEEAAVFNLLHSPPYAAKNTNWSAGGTLSVVEQYNGLGYARKGRPSPYVWSGTDQYVRGKYVADGTYDPNTVDPQLGAAVMLSALLAHDPSIQLDGDRPGQDSAGVGKEVSHTVGGAAAIWASLKAAWAGGLEDWVVYTIGAVAVVALALWIYHVYTKKKGEV